jgi:hypothetical protein
MRLFFPPFFFPSLGCFVRFFFNRVFGRFVTRGVQKRHKKNRAKISSASKKSTHLLTSLFFFFTAPLVKFWLLIKPQVFGLRSYS